MKLAAILSASTVEVLEECASARLKQRVINKLHSRNPINALNLGNIVMSNFFTMLSIG